MTNEEKIEKLEAALKMNARKLDSLLGKDESKNDYQVTGSGVEIVFPKNREFEAVAQKYAGAVSGKKFKLSIADKKVTDIRKEIEAKEQLIAELKKTQSFGNSQEIGRLSFERNELNAELKNAEMEKNDIEVNGEELQIQL